MKKTLLLAALAVFPAMTFAQQEEEETENGVVSVADKDGFVLKSKKGDFVFKPYLLVQGAANFNYTMTKD